MRDLSFAATEMQLFFVNPAILSMKDLNSPHGYTYSQIYVSLLSCSNLLDKLYYSATRKLLKNCTSFSHFFHLKNFI